MAISKEWWDAWWKKDYSWDGLAEKAWAGWRVPIDANGVDAGEPLPVDEIAKEVETRPANLQDYWRRAGITENDLIEMPGESGKRFTLMHLPPHWPDGAPTAKANPVIPPDALTELLEAQLAEDIRKSNFALYGFLQGADYRLQWQGGVLPFLNLELLYQQAEGGRSKIPISINCNQAVFSSAANLENVDFSGTADFQNAAFFDRADFDNATFSGRAEFQNAAFFGWADFTNATFSDRVDFQNAAFSGWTDFENAAFSDSAYFKNATFAGTADFQSAAFSDSAGFENAAFSGWANFMNTAFSGWADFLNATFSGTADFQNALFSDSADFLNAAFSDSADFLNAVFLKGVYFSGLARSVTSDPAEAELLVQIIDDGATEGTLKHKSSPSWTAKRAFVRASFEGAQFFGHASFDNRDFHDAANFDGAQFYRAAEFQGSDLHKKISFTRAKFDRALTPRERTLEAVDKDTLRRLYKASPIPEDETEKPDFATWRAALEAGIKEENEEAANDEDRYFERVEDGFRSLKQIMEERRNRSAESFFFKRELKARRKRKDDQVPWWEAPVSLIFEGLSDFGTSVFRPLLWLFGFAVIFALLYQFMGWNALFSADFLDTLRFSFSRVFPFGPWAEVDPESTIGQLLTASDDWTLEKRLPYNTGTDIVISILAVLQSFLSAVLIFLSALAVRRRFQIN